MEQYKEINSKVGRRIFFVIKLIRNWHEPLVCIFFFFSLYLANGLFSDYSVLIKFALILMLFLMLFFHLLRFWCCFNGYHYLCVFEIVKFWWPVAFSNVITMKKLSKILDTTSHSNSHVPKSSGVKFHTLLTKWTIWWKLSP